MAASIDGRAAWRDLEDLLAQDSSVTSVEFGRLGSVFDCRIRRSIPVHVVVGSGPSPSAALHNAVQMYRERQ